MGNRAIIAFEQPGYTTPSGTKVGPRIAGFGVYLHWNGGIESIEAYLEYLNTHRPCGDISYFSARFVECVGRFFGGTLSIGLHAFSSKDTRAIRRYHIVPENQSPVDRDYLRNNVSPGDNGIFVIGYDKEVKKFVIKAQFTDRWLEPALLENEKILARKSVYWTAKPTIVEGIKFANAFPEEEAEEAAA